MAFECIVCLNQDGKTLYADCEDYYLRKPYRATYARCTSCGVVQQNPIPADLGPFYDAYPIHEKKGLAYRLLRKLVMGPVYFDTRGLPKGTVLLDFGCGDGWFLDEQKPRGLRLIGYERDAEHAKRLSEKLRLAIYSDPDRLELELRGQVDALTMHHVLEHLPSVHDAFRKSAALLKHGGIFYFCIPNLNSLEARVFREKWHLLDPPRHLSFLTPETIRSLAARYGFEAEEIRPMPAPNGFAGSLPVLLTGRFHFPLFLLFLPFGILLSRIFPGGFIGCRLRKIHEE